MSGPEDRARTAGLAMLSLHAGDVQALTAERDALAQQLTDLRAQRDQLMAAVLQVLEARCESGPLADRHLEEALDRLDRLHVDLTDAALAPGGGA